MAHPYAIVFPGQGSQSVGMLADVAEHHPEIRATLDEASQVLNVDLWQMSQHGPAEMLDQTHNTQPALLAASYAVWRILEKAGVAKPAMLAGHSLGEYTALVCAKALNFQDAIKLVAARGHYMQEAVAAGTGAMAAIIGLSNEKVAELCKQTAEEGEILSPANFNSVGQVVIAGHKAAVERAAALAKEQGAKMAVMIPVSVPSHCQLMLPAAKRLQTLLETLSISTPQIPVINNVDVQPYQDAASIRDGLVRQLSMPVRWVETVEYMMRAGIGEMVECGPGKVLTGLNKRIDKNLQLFATADQSLLDGFLQQQHERGA
jgi:[acyl-carrier-protein] S-malonyltransferase